jgi:predicted glycosyltransferase
VISVNGLLNEGKLGRYEEGRELSNLYPRCAESQELLQQQVIVARQHAGEESAPVRVGQRPHRIVFYSHDTQGLGHMRRNLTIAQALLTLEPRPNILLIGGAHEMGALTIPAGIDCLILPALGKTPDGRYYPRSLSVSMRRLITLRASAIEAALRSFEPDLLIVDKVPLGAFGELEPGLAWLHTRGRARCVLGLREILDEPVVTLHEWQRDNTDAVIERYYHSLWIYGDPLVYDPVREYALSRTVAAKVVYTGYIDRGGGVAPTGQPAASETLAYLRLPDGCRLALCVVGGGQDGAALAEAFAHASRPPDMAGVIVTGPFMPPEIQRRLLDRASVHKNLRVLTFLNDLVPLLRRADLVVAMGGYNTICEILSLEKRALIVPRVEPRREQLIRATRLRQLGLVEMIHPDDLSPAAIGAWLRTGHAARSQMQRVNLGALERIPKLADALCAQTPRLKERAYGIC